jgi:hypothetical protein
MIRKHIMEPSPPAEDPKPIEGPMSPGLRVDSSNDVPGEPAPTTEAVQSVAKAKPRATKKK